MHEPNFSVPKMDASVISEIAKRAHQNFGSLTGRKPIDFVMDITAVHANGCPLRLQALLDADEFNFTHDVLGIYRHLDRDTGQLGDCFTPKYAQ